MWVPNEDRNAETHSTEPGTPGNGAADAVTAAIARVAPYLRWPTMMLGLGFVVFAPVIKFTAVAEQQDPTRGFVGLASVLLGVSMIALGAGWPDRYRTPNLIVGIAGVLIGPLFAVFEISDDPSSGTTDVAFMFVVLSIGLIAVSRVFPTYSRANPAILALFMWSSLILVLPHSEWWTYPEFGSWTTGRLIAVIAAGLIAATALPLVVTALIGPDVLDQTRRRSPST